MISGEVIKYLKIFFVFMFENYRGFQIAASSPDSTIQRKVLLQIGERIANRRYISGDAAHLKSCK
jgi:hypothetical protein